MTKVLGKTAIALAAALSLAPTGAMAISLNQLLQDNFLIDDGSGVVDPGNQLQAFECTSATSANVTISFTTPFEGSFQSSVTADEVIDECANFDDDNNDDGGGDDGDGGDANQAGFDANQAAEVIDSNLNDIFPELLDGDVFGALGVPEPPILLLFDADRRNQACKDCNDRLAALQAQLDKEKAFLDARRAALEGLVALDQDAIAAEGLPTLDELIAEHPQIDQLALLQEQRQAQIEALQVLRKDFPFLKDITGGANSSLGGNTEALLEAALASNRASTERATALDAAGRRKTAEFAITAFATGRSAVGALATGDPIKVAKALAGTFGTTKKLLEAAFVGIELNELEFNLRREIEQIALLSEIDSLNKIIAAARGSFEEDAREEQIEQVQRQIEVIKAGMPSQERVVGRLRQQVDEAKKLCAKLCPVTTSLNGAPAGYVRAMARTRQGVVTASGNSFAFSLNLSELRNHTSVAYSQSATGTRRGEPLVDLPGLLGDERFNVFASGEVSISDDNRANGQDGISFSVGGGFSWLVADGVNVGLAGRFSNTDLDGATGSIDGNTFSFAAFAQTQILDEIRLDAIAAYSSSSIDAEILNGGALANANVDADAFSLQVKASRGFDVDGISITPSGSLTYTHVKRDAFTFSNGQTAADFSDNVVTLSGGVSAGTTFYSDDGKMQFSPSLSVGGFAGLTDGGAGANLSAGLGVRSVSGLSANLSAGFSGLNGGQDVFSAGLTFSIPLN